MPTPPPPPPPPPPCAPPATLSSPTASLTGAAIQNVLIEPGKFDSTEDRRDVLRKILRIINYVIPHSTKPASAENINAVPSAKVNGPFVIPEKSGAASLSVPDSFTVLSTDVGGGKWRVTICMVHTAPVQQIGPNCGFAALAVVGQLLQPNAPTSAVSKISVEVMINWAVEQKYTLVGEMFSTANLLFTLTHHFSCTARLKLFSDPATLDAASKEEAMQSIIAHLERDGVVIVPYDMGKNHEPEMANGHSAHWAVVVGLVRLEDRTSTFSSPQYVICRHGQSSRHAVWNLRDLVDSNFGLREMGAKRLASNVAYAVDDCTDLRELRASAIFVDIQREEVIWRCEGDLATLMSDFGAVAV